MRQEWEKDDVNYQLDFFYDTQGKPLAVIYRQNGNGLSYYYLTNQQGDVTKLYKPVAVTTNGKTIVNMVEIATYSYDPWGKATVTVNTGSQITNNDRTLASINPLRYRGYYQDVETGFYYLQSRYYDPVIGRFINADLPEYAALSATDITGTNLFAYCKNDPINHADEDGEWLHVVIGAIAGGVTSYISARLAGENVKDALVSAAFGTATGALTALFPGASAAIGAISGAAESVYSDVKNGASTAKVISNAVISAGFGALGNSEAGYFTKKSTAKEAKAAFGMIKKTVKGNAPNVKKAARKTIRAVRKKFGKQLAYESITGAFYGGMQKGTKKYVKMAYRYYRLR